MFRKVHFSKAMQVNAVIALFCLFVLISVITMGSINTQAGRRKAQKETTNIEWELDDLGNQVLSGNLNYTFSKSTLCEFKIKNKSGECPDVIYLKAKMTGMDAAQSKFKLHVQFHPLGEL